MANSNKIKEMKYSKKRAKTAPGRPKNPLTPEIIERLKAGQNGTQIARDLNVTKNCIYSIAKNYKEEIERAVTIRNTVNLDKYESVVSDNIKTSLIDISNTIGNYNLNKASLNQLTYVFGILFDKLRIIEGKSTNNIAVNIISSLNDDQVAIIQDSIRSLKESMLKQD